MHTRYPCAAIATDERPFNDFDSRNSLSRSRTTRPFPSTLWASSPMSVRGGRLIGVRLRDSLIEVALVAHGAEHLRWVPASTVLTERQAAAWLTTSRFQP
jgi:hypothetical protein